VDKLFEEQVSEHKSTVHINDHNKQIIVAFRGIELPTTLEG